MGTTLSRCDPQQSLSGLGKVVFLEFYGFDEQPFGVTPDPKYFFETGSHCEALATLICGIEQFTGFAALFSEPGLGKTTLLFQILEKYHNRCHTAFVFNTQCDSKGLLRQVAEELQLEVENDVITIHSALRKLISTHPYKLPVIIIVDEGQDLDERALESLRLLSNFEVSSRKLMHFILAGQPELAAKLAAPNLRQLLDRLATLSRLKPLASSEVEHYISHRLSIAGYAGPPIFTKEAVDAIVRGSSGVPRQVNRICFNSLSLGFARRQTRVGHDIAAEVPQDLDIRLALPNDTGRHHEHRRDFRPAAISHRPESTTEHSPAGRDSPSASVQLPTAGSPQHTRSSWSGAPHETIPPGCGPVSRLSRNPWFRPPSSRRVSAVRALAAGTVIAVGCNAYIASTALPRHSDARATVPSAAFSSESLALQNTRETQAFAPERKASRGGAAADKRSLSSAKATQAGSISIAISPPKLATRASTEREAVLSDSEQLAQAAGRSRSRGILQI